LFNSFYSILQQAYAADKEDDDTNDDTYNYNYTYAEGEEEAEDAVEEDEDPDASSFPSSAPSPAPTFKNKGYYGGEYSDYKEPDVDADGVVAFCSAMYYKSAHCNVHLENYSQVNASEIEITQETRNCAFIDNIIYGTFDEQGDIELTSPVFDFSDWKNPEQYRKVKLPAGQAVSLALSVLLVVSLSATAIFMNRSLHRKDMPWRPRRFGRHVDPHSLSRNPSGITLGRSRSPGNTPLI
jgi:hypothetical protein